MCRSSALGLQQRYKRLPLRGTLHLIAALVYAKAKGCTVFGVAGELAFGDSWAYGVQLHWAGAGENFSLRIPRSWKIVVSRTEASGKS